MTTCTLCELPVSDDPVTAAGVDGTFCCRGCLEINEALADVEGLEQTDLEAPTDESTDRTVPEDAEETFLTIDGMHCGTCEGFLSLLGERESGIIELEANYATDTARVVYDSEVVSREELPTQLSGHGYSARFPDEEGDTRRRDDAIMQRLVIGAIMTLLIKPWYLFFLYPSYVGIETGIFEVDATTVFGMYFPLVMIALMTTVVLVVTGYPILRGAYVSLRVGQPNMDLLIAIAAVAAYAYSTVALAMGSTHLYYDVTVAVVMVVTIGTYYERNVKQRATDRLSELTAARAREATRRTAAGTETVSVEDLEPGDEVLVRPGDRVPIDGTVLEGTAAVDESVLTGESLPVTKGVGDDVVGGAIVTDNALVLEVGADAQSTLDRIATLLWEIQSATPGIQRFADKLATIFVPLVVTIATIVTAYHLLTGAPIADALLVGLTVLVVSCPCAMGLATPLAVASGLRDGLERGIVVTNVALFESGPDADTVVFDKTGTLTEGEMEVLETAGETDAIRKAAAVEQFSAHPAGAALVDFVDSGLESDTDRGDGDPVATDGGIATAAPAGGEHVTAEPTDFERHPGEGVSAVLEGKRVVVGTPTLVERLVGPVPGDLRETVDAAHERGRLPVVVGFDGRARAVAVVGDRERDEWREVFERVEDTEVVVLTGDDEAATASFRDHPAVDRVFAGVPPDGKVETIRRLTGTGVTTMVGDGTNDAPALAAADVGIALDTGTARAADAADAIVTNGLDDVRAVFDLASGTRRRIRENVCWALLYNAVAIPLAALGLINPLFAALAMAASSLIVVKNSSRPVLREATTRTRESTTTRPGSENP
ncbi:cation-translocating P-type ATPase [Salinadaptatus halalkaliphilus]|uniref:Cation-translocating P-type ATPase n=1 Tax=Salinadaptatus halalkaliphilus TaxID=2419781 RepID=A0A4S3TQ85_9EURY|nr:cation-translocating P-type ATPase [Salinadaptatus halalkaliphilus]THE66542.1 cation-translocating P-type ATPase [Salinadaptatus halalkaliphilus]